MQLAQLVTVDPPPPPPSLTPIHSTLQAPARRWMFPDALALIRTLQPSLIPFGYHLTLGGGVLNAGESGKDLDLYFLPMDNKGEIAPDKLIAFLTELWGKGKSMFKKKSEPRVTRGRDGTLQIMPTPEYPTQLNSPYIYKKIHFYSGLRIDVFIIGMTDQALKEEKVSEEQEGEDTPRILTLDDDAPPRVTNTPPAGMSPEDWNRWQSLVAGLGNPRGE